MAGRPPHRKISKSQYVEALRAARGLVSVAAERLGMTPNGVYKAIQRMPELREVQEEATEKMLDFAEAKLYQHIADDNLQATVFYLKTRGKHRGYVEKQEQAGEMRVVVEHVRQPIPED